MIFDKILEIIWQEIFLETLYRWSEISNNLKKFFDLQENLGGKKIWKTLWSLWENIGKIWLWEILETILLNVWMKFFSVLEKLYPNLDLKILEKIFEKPREACRLWKFDIMRTSGNNFLKYLDDFFFRFWKNYTQI